MIKNQRHFVHQKYVIAAGLVEYLDPLAIDDIFDTDVQAKVRNFVDALPKPGHWSWRSELVPVIETCNVLSVPLPCVQAEWVHEVVTAS